MADSGKGGKTGGRGGPRGGRGNAARGPRRGATGKGSRAGPGAAGKDGHRAFLHRVTDTLAGDGPKGRFRLGLAVMVGLVLVVAVAGLGSAWRGGGEDSGSGAGAGLTVAVNRPALPAITGRTGQVQRGAATDGGQGGDAALQDGAGPGEAEAESDAIGDLIQQLEKQGAGAPRGNPEGADAEALAALPRIGGRRAPHARGDVPGEAGFARIVIVIDDLGGNAAATRRLMALPGPVTYAFLTAHAGAPQQAETVAAAGFDVMLHMPMEPQGGQDPGPNALLVENDRDENLRRLQWHMARLPGAIGVNNHMGSRFTSDVERMRPVLEAVQAANLFFLDSRTSGRSIGYEVARDLQMPTLHRDIFLDHEPDEASIRRQLMRAEAVAAREGHAIAIGHPYPETLAVLERWMPQAQKRGYVLVGISDLLPRRQTAPPDLSDGGDGVAARSGTSSGASMSN